MTAAELFAADDRGAVLSEDRVYRYELWRRWADGPLLGWIMLNPSTADGLVDDRTVTQCCRVARRDGYAGITVRNLFAFRTSSPKVLSKAQIDGVDVVGPQNDEAIQSMLADRFSVRDVVLAWGAINAWHDRVFAVESAVVAAHRRPLCLGVTEHGWPRHPSRIASAAQLTRFGP